MSKNVLKLSVSKLSVLATHRLQPEAKVNLQVVPKSLAEKTLDIWCARWEQSWPSLAVIWVCRVGCHSVPRATQRYWHSIQELSMLSKKAVLEIPTPWLCGYTFCVGCSALRNHLQSPIQSLLCSAVHTVHLHPPRVRWICHQRLLWSHCTPLLKWLWSHWKLKCTKINLSESIDWNFQM